jgi:hypothetical protein
MQGCKTQARAELIMHEQAVAIQLGEYVHHLPKSARPLGVRLQNGIVNCEDTSCRAKEKLLIDTHESLKNFRSR